MRKDIRRRTISIKIKIIINLVKKTSSNEFIVLKIITLVVIKVIISRQLKRKRLYIISLGNNVILII